MAGSSRRSILHHFKKGAQIEISSNDEGFRGSLYTGTVIKPPKDESSLVLVEYETLKADTKGKRPLKESLSLVDLRPAPPKEERLTFEFSDEVDAYHNDGWWEGVITEASKEKDEYKVFFRGTREELVYKASQLRVHREWIKGMWIPPLDPSAPLAAPQENISRSSAEAEANEEVNAEAEANEEVNAEGEANEEVNAEAEANEEVNAEAEANEEVNAEAEANEEVIEHIFKSGDRVEVRSNEEGFQGAWFGATVIEQTMAGKYLIEYQSLRNDDDTDFLREEVNVDDLRPYPPDVASVDGFARNDKVDALYNDGWWVGVVSRVLKNDRYTVYFQYTEEKLKFEHSDLRVHQEWKNGEWHIGS